MSGIDVVEVLFNQIDFVSNGEIDDCIEYAIDHFDDWIRDLDENEIELLSVLMPRFNYYSYKSVKVVIKELFDNAIQRFGLSTDDTVVSVVRKKNATISSSIEYWTISSKEINLSKKVFIDNLDCLNDAEWNNIKKVLFVDDCSGTGKQFIDFMQRQNRTRSFSGKQVIFIVVEIMEDAEKRIKEEMSKMGIDIEVMYHVSSPKALIKMTKDEKNTFFALSKKREINKQYIYGYGDAEALFSFYNNTPNDTLGLFWCETRLNKAIFPRNDDQEPGWRIRDDKEKRKKQRRDSKC